MASQLPDAADVVIIGGGVVGVSAAFHLAEAGVERVLLLERDALGSGSTCKAAGGVRAQFSDEVSIRLGARSLEAFARFGERPGQDVDLHTVGYLFLLDDAGDVAAFEQAVALQNALGVGSRLVEAAEAALLSPVVRTDDVLAAAWSPADGHCSPEAVVLGYASAARRLGATLLTGCTATGIEHDGGAITAVTTDRGRVATSSVVCAAGAWSAAVGGWAGVDLPVTPLRRQVAVTSAITDLPPGLPFTIDFSTSFYLHREGQGLLVGMSDPDETPGFAVDRHDRWLPRLAAAIGHRAPQLLEHGVSTAWAGLYEVTPDHNALIGRSEVLPGFTYATGFSGHGFLMGPAVGEVVRDLVLDQAPVVDVSSLVAERFSTAQLRPERHVV